MPFLVNFSNIHFLIKHKARVQNVVTDALNRRHTLLRTLQMKVVGFDVIKELYQDDPDFQKHWNATKLITLLPRIL